MGNALVSVILPTHERPKLLRRAIESVLCQSYSNFELIVVDDSASATGCSVVEAFQDSRIKYHRNVYSKGACGSRNTGIRYASGTYCTGLDDDDYFNTHRLESLVRAYEPKYAFVASNTLVLQRPRPEPLFRGDKQIAMKDILWCNCVGNQVFSETYKLREAGGFDESLVAAQDWEFWVRMIEKWGCALRVETCSYNLDREHGSDRIGTQGHDTIKRQKFLRLHGNKMTLAQRLVHSARIRKYSNRSYVVSSLGAVVFPSFWTFVFEHRIRKRL